MSEEETAYLRRVLADVHPVTGSPLSILQQAFTGAVGGSGAIGQTALATQTEGYSVTDLKDLVARAVHRAAIRSSQVQSGSYEDPDAVQVRIPHAFVMPSGLIPSLLHRPR